MNTIPANTPVADLTVSQLMDIVREAMNATPSVVYGIQGIADLFGVSYTQAKRIKASGVIDKAISQSGRTIIVNSAKALELFGTKH